MGKKLPCIIVLLGLCLSCNEKAGKSSSDSIVSPVATETRAASQDVRVMFFKSAHIFLDENGAINGPLYDFMKDISKEMGVNLIWDTEYTTIPRQIDIIQNTENTAIALLSINDERAAIMNYSETPYFKEHPALALHKDNPLKKIESEEDILDLTIGYAEGGFVTPFMQDERIDYDLVSNPDYYYINLKKLMTGRIDAVYSPGGKTTLFSYIKDLGLEDKVKLLSLPEPMTPYYFIFTKKSPELVEKYNAAFRKLNGEQLYLEKLSKYVDLSLYYE